MPKINLKPTFSLLLLLSVVPLLIESCAHPSHCGTKANKRKAFSPAPSPVPVPAAQLKITKNKKVDA